MELSQKYKDINCFFYKICKNKINILFINGESLEFYVYEGQEINFCNKCKEFLEIKYGINWNYEKKSFFDKILDRGRGKDFLCDKLDRDLSERRKPLEIQVIDYHKKILNLKKSQKIERKRAHERKIKENLKLENSIISLLKKKRTKMPASDIDAHLKSKDIDNIKRLCEKMYLDGKIGRSGNYRYFIIIKDRNTKSLKPKVKKAFASQPDEVDVEKELKKIKSLLDKDLITQEQYDAKSNEILGL